jgi:hypothetical protein
MNGAAESETLAKERMVKSESAKAWLGAKFDF